MSARLSIVALAVLAVSQAACFTIAPSPMAQRVRATSLARGTLRMEEGGEDAPPPMEMPPPPIEMTPPPPPAEEPKGFDITQCVDLFPSLSDQPLPPPLGSTSPSGIGTIRGRVATPLSLTQRRLARSGTRCRCRSSSSSSSSRASRPPASSTSTKGGDMWPAGWPLGIGVVHHSWILTGWA